MNRTEARLSYKLAGLTLPHRHLSMEQLLEMETALALSNQAACRNALNAFVQEHWRVLKETLTCNGDCASPENRCPDAQAAACYLSNRDAVDRQ